MNNKINQMPEWLALSEHADDLGKQRIDDLFKTNPSRFEHFSLSAAGLLYDYSKHKVDSYTVKLLCDLARANGLTDWIDRQFSGERINITEQRAVLHTALRRAPDTPLMVDGHDVMPDVEQELHRMENFVEAVHSRKWLGATGQPIKTIVNIGIGGSHLGPEMVCRALRPHWKTGIDIRFVANVDPAQISEVLRDMDAASTLFIIASKTFTTQETMANAAVARKWIIENLGSEDAIPNHCVAVSTNTKAVAEFGIDTNHMFSFWDWVGGRFSLWSVIGLPIALAVGMTGFRQLLAGAKSMDEHFATQPLESNMPVLMGLLGIWCRNFLSMPTQAVIPYSENLSLLPAFLQQGEMESNGKSTARDGSAVEWQTAPVIWGEPGTNSQHAFFQLLHQGTQIIPVDFVLIANSEYDSDQHRLLIANALAQSCALMQGKNQDQVRDELLAAGMEQIEIENLVNHRSYAGDRPSSTVVLDRLDAFNLGALIALYEHKIFVQGVIWQICSFDQWGVELGKQVAAKVEGLFADNADLSEMDGSTRGLLAYLGNRNKIS